MKMMKSLTALTLSAALVPAMALSTSALAEERDGMQTGEQQSPGEQQQRTGERQQDGEQWQAGDQQQQGEQYISSKPSGGFFADDVIGKSVKNRGSDQEIGEIKDLVIGEDGRIAGVVVQTGGHLGLGGQDVGLGWDNLEHSMEEDESTFYLDMDEEELQNAPEFERE